MKLCPFFLHMKYKISDTDEKKFIVQSLATHMKGEAGLVAAKPRTFQCPNDLLLEQVET